MGSMHDKVSKLKAAALSKNGRTYVVGAAILVFFFMLLTLSSGGSSGQQVNAERNSEKDIIVRRPVNLG